MAAQSIRPQRSCTGSRAGLRILCRQHLPPTVGLQVCSLAALHLSECKEGGKSRPKAGYRLHMRDPVWTRGLSLLMPGSVKAHGTCSWTSHAQGNSSAMLPEPPTGFCLAAETSALYLQYAHLFQWERLYEACRTAGASGGSGEATVTLQHNPQVATPATGIFGDVSVPLHALNTGFKRLGCCRL